MKRLLLPVLIIMILITASACSKAETPAPSDTAPATAESVPETAPEPVSEPAIEFTTEGTYVLFGVLNEGYTVKSSEIEMEAVIVLTEGGTGSMSFDGDSIDITEWTLKGDAVSLTTSDGGQADAIVHDGILDLDLYGNGVMILYFAQENADISGYEFTPIDEVREALNGD